MESRHITVSSHRTTPPSWRLSTPLGVSIICKFPYFIIINWSQYSAKQKKKKKLLVKAFFLSALFSFFIILQLCKIPLKLHFCILTLVLQHTQKWVYFLWMLKLLLVHCDHPSFPDRIQMFLFWLLNLICEVILQDSKRHLLLRYSMIS